MSISKYHAEGDKEEGEDMIPSEESEMVAVLHEIMEDGINYYKDMSLGGTRGQRQYFMGMINALNITLKEINQLGPAKGLMRIKKVHRKRVHDRIKHRKTENLPFDAGLLDGFDEAAHRILEMTYPLYIGSGFSKSFQEGMRAEEEDEEYIMDEVFHNYGFMSNKMMLGGLAIIIALAKLAQLTVDTLVTAQKLDSEVN